MVGRQSRYGFAGWVLQLFLGISVVLVSLLVADSLGMLHHGESHGAPVRSSPGGISGSIRSSDMGAFDSGKFSSKEAWFYHRVGGQGGGGP